jgi:hypothetical protein
MNEKERTDLMYFFLFLWKFCDVFCRLIHGLLKGLLSIRMFLVMVIYGMLLWPMVETRQQK